MRTTLFQRKVAQPLWKLLSTGATPERLAFSLAVGALIGINPLLGSTTLLALALAAIFRLNVVASQLACHLCYPIELLLLPVFLRLGDLMFDSPSMPLAPKAMLAAFKSHPWLTTRSLWTWEWHASVAWLGLSVVLLPALAYGLRPPLRHMLRDHCEREIVPSASSTP
jgi:uncharacterized protein (DUF2062 family)